MNFGERAGARRTRYSICSSVTYMAETVVFKANIEPTAASPAMILNIGAYSLRPKTWLANILAGYYPKVPRVPQRCEENAGYDNGLLGYIPVEQIH